MEGGSEQYKCFGVGGGRVGGGARVCECACMCVMMGVQVSGKLGGGGGGINGMSVR